MKLSKRLSAIAGMVDPCDSVTDIGCDHGYLSVWLLEKGICRHAVAADIKKGPLERARANRDEHGISGNDMELILSDGLKGLAPPDESLKNTLVIAGMGGETIAGILSGEAVKAAMYDSYVFSPHTRQEELRRYLGSSGYRITDERYPSEDGILYTVIKAVKGTDSCESDADYILGPFIGTYIKEPDVYAGIRDRYLKMKQLINDADIPEDRVREIKKEMKIYEGVLRD
ncbi:MAG: SAM-dependent methyltransferase [Lachnospiraceae bacterium]|nr:SAM-dependent methyltransferase [Lachnospiraceae bacterium]